MQVEEQCRAIEQRMRQPTTQASDPQACERGLSSCSCVLLDPSPTALDGYVADPLDHSDDGTQVDTSCQMSESFTLKDAPPNAARSPAAATLLYSSGRIICLLYSACASSPALLTQYSCRHGGLHPLAVVLAGHELSFRGCLVGALEGPAPAPTARKACLRGELGDRRRRLQSRQAARQARTELLELSRRCFRPMGGNSFVSKAKAYYVLVVHPLIWIEDNPKGQSPGLSSEEWQGRTREEPAWGADLSHDFSH